MRGHDGGGVERPGHAFDGGVVEVPASHSFVMPGTAEGRIRVSTTSPKRKTWMPACAGMTAEGLRDRGRRRSHDGGVVEAPASHSLVMPGTAEGRIRVSTTSYPKKDVDARIRGHDDRGVARPVQHAVLTTAELLRCPHRTRSSCPGRPKAGSGYPRLHPKRKPWMPAFAGMTTEGLRDRGGRRSDDG